MSLNTNALTTVDRVKTFLGITVASSDAILESLINQVSDFVEHYCNRTFVETTYTDEFYDGTGTDKLFLFNYPVSTTDTFTLQGRAGTQNIDSFDEIDSEKYFIDYTTGILETTGWGFSERPRKYRVTYTAGYAFKNNAAPLVTLESVNIGDLEFAVWKLVANAFLMRKDTSNVQSETIGDYSVTFRKSTMTDKEIQDILNRYRRPHKN